MEGELPFRILEESWWKQELPTEEEMEESGKTDVQIKKVLQYIETRYTQPITLEECAAAAGYSKFHFSRQFKALTGLAFTDYINRKRIRAAELQLCRTNLSVTDIAMRSGFGSLTTFNRVFRKVKNCTPSTFKQLYLGQNDGKFVEDHFK